MLRNLEKGVGSCAVRRDSEGYFDKFSDESMEGIRMKFEGRNGYGSNRVGDDQFLGGKILHVYTYNLIIM